MYTVKKYWILLAVFLLLVSVSSASAEAEIPAEVKISLSPASARVGDYIDVTVTPSREGARGVIYELSTPEGSVFKGEEVTHFTASFRPRTEADHTLTVTVVYGKKDTESASVTVPVSGFAPEQKGKDVVYQQKDGWWKKKKYAVRSVEKAGCALFTLSHALQRMGYEGEDLMPDALAVTYKGFYIEGRGTANELFLRKAGEKYQFITQVDLDKSPSSIASCLKRGDYYSFSIVNGHIALADGLSEDGKMLHIVDSAAGATYERIKGSSPYYLAEDGTFVAAEKPEDLPGLRWYFESQEYGGAEYWLPMDYCAKRGLRLIRPYWLKLETADGLKGVEIDYFGAMISKIILNGESVRVPTRELQWKCVGASSPKVGIVTKQSGAPFTDAEGKNIPGNAKIRYGYMFPVLEIQEDRLYIAWKDTFGYVSLQNAEILDVLQEDAETGLISINGKTNVAATVNVRMESKVKSKVMAEWKAGTPVAVADRKEGFVLVEGKGLRGWIEDKYLTMDGGESNGKTVDKGK